MRARYRPPDPYPAGPRPCAMPGCTQAARSRHKLCGAHLRELSEAARHDRLSLDDVTDIIEEVEVRDE